MIDDHHVFTLQKKGLIYHIIVNGHTVSSRQFFDKNEATKWAHVFVSSFYCSSLEIDLEKDNESL